MKKTLILPCLLVIATSATIYAQQRGKKKAPPSLKWEVKQLHKDNNEGAAVGDINGDGKLDVTAGEYWYPAPDFPQKPVRKVLPFGADYMQNNA